jgi:N-methylhydantoinase A/oxoprolinase/acetone carboxylase beta subunit
VTDADLLLGRLDAGSPLAGDVALDRAAAERAVARLAQGLGLSTLEAAAGIARVASAEMAAAVRVVTVARGIDPRDLALVAFGGAGPLHATEIAAELRMSRVVVPVAGGVLSALGLVVSERRRDVVESVLLDEDELAAGGLRKAVERLGRRALEQLGDPGAELRLTYELRYEGQAFELPVDAAADVDPADLRRAFDRAHAARYGYADEGARLELVTIRAAAALPGAEPATGVGGAASERGSRPVLFGGTRHEARVIGPGEAELEGPAVVELEGSTLVVPPGWRGRAGADAVTLERAA